MPKIRACRFCLFLLEPKQLRTSSQSCFTFCVLLFYACPQEYFQRMRLSVFPGIRRYSLLLGYVADSESLRGMPAARRAQRTYAFTTTFSDSAWMWPMRSIVRTGPSRIPAMQSTPRSRSCFKTSLTYWLYLTPNHTCSIPATTARSYPHTSLAPPYTTKVFFDKNS